MLDYFVDVSELVNTQRIIETICQDLERKSPSAPFEKAQLQFEQSSLFDLKVRDFVLAYIRNIPKQSEEVLIEGRELRQTLVDMFGDEFVEIVEYFN